MSTICSAPDQPVYTGRSPIRRTLLDRIVRHRAADILLLLALSGILFFYGLGSGQLRGTESLRALVAEGFLRSGNWIVPTLYGEPLFTKPPGAYAVIALVSWPFGGVSEVTARLPSALAATITVLLIYWYFGRVLGRRGGLVAALIAPIAPLWLEKATSAEMDMLQLAWVTAAILFFLRALEEEEAAGSGQRAVKVRPTDGDPKPTDCNPWAWFASLLCVAGGVLTKWTAPAFFYLTVVPLLWWRGRLRLLWGRRHLTSAALAAGICLAWAGAAITLGGWEAFWRTITNEALQRFSPAHSPKPYPWLASLLHPLKLLALTLPWSAAALMTFRPGFCRLWDEGGRRLLQALHCWAWPNLLFWSLPTEHTPRHSFPLFPAISGLAAMAMLAWMSGRLPWRLPYLRPQQLLAAMLALWLLVKVVLVEVVVPRRHPWGGPRAAAQAIAALVPAGATLYILRLKDEGIMFYFGGEVRRVPSAAALPQGPLWCVLTDQEWRHWNGLRRAEVRRRLYDGQGDPIVLVQLPG
jgi:4-amino-4-deoxy-L-arabinose transferase-like glycosyltransferase